MLETLKNSILINFSISLNSWIYFLKRMPFLKNVFQNVGYEYSDATKVIFPLAIVYSIIKQFFKSILLVALSFGLPYLIMMQDISTWNTEAAYWTIFLFFYLLLPLSTSKILEPHKRKFISVKLMRMDARSFVFADYFPLLICRQLVELLPFILMAYLYGVPMVLALFMLIGKNLFALCSEVLQIKYYDKTGDFLHNKTIPILLYASIILGVGYTTTFLQYYLIIPPLFLLLLGILIWMAGLLSLRYLLQYRRYMSAINDANRLDKLNIDVKSVKKNAEFARVKLKDKEFSTADLQYDKSNKKEGFRYINEIFFKRHNRILNKPIKLQIILVLFLFATGVILSFLLPSFNQLYEKTLMKIFPVFVFVLYIMSTGQKATKAMFYNCDNSLLHYGFYKTKEAVLATFTLRAKYLILTNMLPAFLLALGIVVLNVVTGGSLITLAPVGIMIIFLSIFFAVHNLFLYYIFQPYTTDLTVKNPFYKFLNSITYLLSYLCLQLENMSATFLFFVIAVTIVYSIAAIITVYRIAPKTFVIK